jgi:uncharacterized membrane protein YeiH
MNPITGFIILAGVGVFAIQGMWATLDQKKSPLLGSIYGLLLALGGGFVTRLIFGWGHAFIVDYPAALEVGLGATWLGKIVYPVKNHFVSLVIWFDALFTVYFATSGAVAALDHHVVNLLLVLSACLITALGGGFLVALILFQTPGVTRLHGWALSIGCLTSGLFVFFATSLIHHQNWKISIDVVMAVAVVVGLVARSLAIRFPSIFKMIT